LTVRRLVSPERAVGEAAERLAKLAADEPYVKTLQSRLDAANATIKKIKTRLPAVAPADNKEPGIDGVNPAAPTTKPDTAAVPEIRLDFGGAKELRDARFYLNAAQGLWIAADDFVAKTKPGDDPSKLNPLEVQQATNTLDAARAKLKLATDRLPNLPANGAGVAAIKADCADAQKDIDATAAALKALHDKLIKG